MLHFARPWALLLLAPLAVCFWAWMRRRNAALRISSVSLVRDLPLGRTQRVRRGPALLHGLALVLIVVALAAPRWPDPGSRVPTEGISIVLVLDVSDSMKNADFLHGTKLQTRWDAVRTIARLFIQGGEMDGATFSGRPHDLIALVTFAQRPETDCPLTLDHEALLSLVDEETPREEQGTNPGDALAWGLHLVSRAPTKRKVLVFLSDGEDNVKGKNLRAERAAEMAAAMDVPIYAVEIEPLPDESRPKSGKAARELMQSLAKTTGGAFYSAKDAAGLLRAHVAIDALERDRIETFQFRRHAEGDAWFAALALSVFLLTVVLQTTRWRITP